MTNQYKQFDKYLREHYPFTKHPESKPVNHQTRISFQGATGFGAPIELYISAFSGFTKGEYKLLCVFHQDGTVVYDGVSNQVVEPGDQLTKLMRVLAPTQIKSDYVGKVMKNSILTEEQLEILFYYVKSEIAAAIPVWGPVFGIESCWC